MKNIAIITSLAGFFILFAESCNIGSPAVRIYSEMQKDSTSLYYTCTMHPEVHSDKPGNCPKCGMVLVKKEAAQCDSTQMHHRTDNTQQMSKECCKGGSGCTNE